MLKKYTPRKYETITEYELAFDDGHHNGFGFPCDAQGNVPEDINQSMKENLKYCIAHPEKFVRYNTVVEFNRRYVEPAHGECICGREIELWDQYYGACECECGRWYNLFGQELVPPEYWEEDLSDEEY